MYSDIKTYLDQKVNSYNQPDYIDSDPIQVPHLFSRKEDIEISAFLTASIAWGQRKTIIQNAFKMMALMDNAPYDFILHEANNTQHLQKFVHRTFNAQDLTFFIQSLHHIYTYHGGLEEVFNTGFMKSGNIFETLAYFRKIFLETNAHNRSRKHVSDVMKNSAAKRLNMFLRWMVRHDKVGVDFGLWNQIPMSTLMLPVDVHAGDVARALGILTRRQNDWKAVEEVTQVLRTFDPSDPIKYDYALFGIGVFENKKEVLPSLNRFI